MTRVHWSRIVLALTLTTAVSTLPVRAEPRAASEGLPARLAAAGAFSQLWSLLTELWGEAGCIIDPHGACGAGSGPLEEAGCVADPHGGCGGGAQGSFTEAGCGIDPHGCPGTRSAPKADEGCLIDPYGGGCSR